MNEGGEILNKLKREQHLTTRDNVDRPGGHHAEGNKPDTEAQIPHNSTYVSHPK